MEFVAVKEIGCDGKTRMRSVLMKRSESGKLKKKNKNYIECDLRREKRFYENIIETKSRFDKKTGKYIENPSTHYLPIEAEKNNY